MKKALLCLLLLACWVVTASADNNPTVNITPSPAILAPGQTQQFTAAFSDGSQIQSCTWLATGPQNAIQSTGVATAMFGAGTLKATYIATANCTNTNNYNATGLAVIVIR
jgi:hypothetical protein